MQEIKWGPFIVFDLWMMCRDITSVDVSGATDPHKVVPKARVLAAWFYFWCIVLPIAAFVRSLFVAAGPDMSIGVRVFMVLFGYFVSLMLLPMLGLLIAGKTWPILGRWLGVEIKS